MTAVCLMLNIMIANYFIVTVLNPVFTAIIQYRPQLEAKCRDSDADIVVSSEELMQQPKGRILDVATFLTRISGVDTMRIMTSNCMGSI